jgi:branched-chain amino acid transport system substrate-binding protein
MSTFRKIITGLLLLFVVLGISTGSRNVSAQGKAPSVPVKIGVMGPFTGPAASIGTEQLNWAKLAVADFNKASGWSVELVEGDTELDAAKAVTVGESLIANKDIYGVVGPAGSQEVEATEPKFKDARLVQVSPSATRPSLTQGGFDTFFRVVPTDAAQGPTDANFMAKQVKATKLFIIDDQTSYSTGLADAAEKAFKDAGGSVVGHESVTQKDQDFSALVTKIKGSGADVVFFPGQIASQGALLGKQFQEQKITATLFGADGFFSSDDFIKGAGGATEGAYVSSFAPDITGIDSSADVVKRYTAQNGSFGTFGPPTYAATLVVLEAMQRASDGGKLDRATVRDEVAKTNQKLSVLGGPMAFDKNGDVLNAQFYIFQVKGGKFVLVPSAAPAMAATMDMSMATMAATAAK